MKPYDMKFPELSEEDIKEIRRHMADKLEYSLRLTREAAAQAERDRAEMFRRFQVAASDNDPGVIRTTVLQLKKDWEPCGACVDGHLSRVCISDDEIYVNSDGFAPENERFQFCPKCGRPMTEEAWAKLEKILKGAER